MPIMALLKSPIFWTRSFHSPLCILYKYMTQNRLYMLSVIILVTWHVSSRLFLTAISRLISKTLCTPLIFIGWDSRSVWRTVCYEHRFWKPYRAEYNPNSITHNEPYFKQVILWASISSSVIWEQCLPHKEYEN